ncbi:hypothetical protein C0J45_1491 [Silurus meridionalis]|nr:hypothetical protein C0J45_1491 [Silurus meridionalis]
MAYRFICVALFLLLIGHMLAVPEIDPESRKDHTAPCKENSNSNLNDRLDAVEKRVEETVQKLEAELAVLLDTIQAPEWSSFLNIDTTGPAVDILDESNIPSQF